jgi:hypothetical protein
MTNASLSVGFLQPLSDIPYGLLAVVQPKNIDVSPVLFVVEVGWSFKKGSTDADVLCAFLMWSNSVGLVVPIPVSPVAVKPPVAMEELTVSTPAVVSDIAPADLV